MGHKHKWVPALTFVPKSGVLPVECSECGTVGYRFPEDEDEDCSRE